MRVDLHRTEVLFEHHSQDEFQANGKPVQRGVIIKFSLQDAHVFLFSITNITIEFLFFLKEQAILLSSLFH